MFDRPDRVKFQPQEKPRRCAHPDAGPQAGAGELLCDVKLPADKIFFVCSLLHCGQTAVPPDAAEAVRISNTAPQSVTLELINRHCSLL
jgi:hypothetical protein